MVAPAGVAASESVLQRLCVSRQQASPGALCSGMVFTEPHMAWGGAEVREYFNNEGFNRWSKIYSESDDVNFVQKYIRSGHQVCHHKCSVSAMCLHVNKLGSKHDR